VCFRVDVFASCLAELRLVARAADWAVGCDDYVIGLPFGAHARRVSSSDGKNASSRSSCAVTSLGVPIVETTEKKLSAAPANAQHLQDRRGPRRSAICSSPGWVPAPSAGGGAAVYPVLNV
jgi:hypothetical protein